MAVTLPAPESLIPLPPATFHILLSLAEEDRHGYAIIQDVAARTSGDVTLGAGTLYRSIQRMLEQDLVIETADRPAPELDDERRRYYRITPFGRRVAEAETRRLADLVRLAPGERRRCQESMTHAHLSAAAGALPVGVSRRVRG